MQIINVPFIEFCGLLNVSCGFQWDMRSCVIRGLDLGGVQTSHRIRFLKFMLLYFHFSFLFWVYQGHLSGVIDIMDMLLSLNVRYLQWLVSNKVLNPMGS